MSRELVEWESEESEMKKNMDIDEIREKSTKEKVSRLDLKQFVARSSAKVIRGIFNNFK